MNKIPIRQIGTKAKDGIVMLAGSEAAAKAGQALKYELKREIKGGARRFVRGKIRESRVSSKVQTETMNVDAALMRNMNS